MYAARGALPPLAPYFFILECHCEARSAAAIPLNYRLSPYIVFARKRSDEANSREGVFPNGGITVSLRAAGAAIPPNNRQSNNTVVSALIAPLKKAQRKFEGGQLFPESVFPLRATPFPKTPQNPPSPLIFKGVSVI